MRLTAVGCPRSFDEAAYRRSLLGWGVGGGRSLSGSLEPAHSQLFVALWPIKTETQG